MKTILFGDYKIMIDNTDVDFLKRFEEAAQRYHLQAEQISVDGTASEMMEQFFLLFQNTFDFLFGEGTTQKMFGGKKSVGEAIKAYKAIVEAVNDYQEVLELTETKRPPQKRTAKKK